jgi:hypothetical protein
VAQRGAATRGEDRCAPPADFADLRAGDRVDAAVEDDEAARGDPAADGGRAETEVEELLMSDHAALL